MTSEARERSEPNERRVGAVWTRTKDAAHKKTPAEGAPGRDFQNGAQYSK